MHSVYLMTYICCISHTWFGVTFTIFRENFYALYLKPDMNIRVMKTKSIPTRPTKSQLKSTTRTSCVCVCVCVCVCIYIYIHTGCPRRNGQNFGKVFLMYVCMCVCVYIYIYIYSIPPDDGLQICPKHVDDWRNKLRINSASSWFSLHGRIEMHGQQCIKLLWIVNNFIIISGFK
jgi:hypothetical protein